LKVAFLNKISVRQVEEDYTLQDALRIIELHNEFYYNEKHLDTRIASYPHLDNSGRQELENSFTKLLDSFVKDKDKKPTSGMSFDRFGKALGTRAEKYGNKKQGGETQ
jgi:hypothetical protein